MISTAHNCLGAECPYCSPWYIKTKQDYAKIATFRDSRGWAVEDMPSVVKVGTCAIITTQEFYGKIPSSPGIKEYESFSKIPWPLLVHKRADNGFWGFVGGAMEPGESLKDCVKREVKEETGIEVWIKDLCCVDSDPTQFSICQYNDGNIIQYCGITFICVANDLTLMRMSPESCDMRIVYSNLLPEPFLPLHRWRLEQARHIFYERHVSYM